MNDFRGIGWFKLALEFKSSVIHSIRIQVLVTMVIATVLTIVYEQGYSSLSQPILAGLIPGIVLGLLLVFRTNTAYEKFSEGWQVAGLTRITMRNLSRQMWLTIPNKVDTKQEKVVYLRLVAAFFFALKQRLRRSGIDDQIKSLLSPEHYLEVQRATNTPLRITQLIGEYITRQYMERQIDSVQFATLNRLLDQLVECLSRGERVLSSPLPKAYAIHLRHLLLLYCFALPFQMIAQLHWWTIPVSGVVAFALFGIEAIGLEIEDPFGCDANDIPLDKLCQDLHKDIEELIAFGTSQKDYSLQI